MTSAVIIAAEKAIDGQGEMSEVANLQQRIQSLGVSPEPLFIDPLSTGWNSPIQPNHFRSGCAPIAALQRAHYLITVDGADAVLVSGNEPLKTGYSREQRLQLMSIYGEDYPLTQAYDELADRFIGKQKISTDMFLRCRDGLFENYQRTYVDLHVEGVGALPEARWFEPLTANFRGVDCANPLIDFQGKVLLVSDRLADRLAIDNSKRIVLAGVQVQRTAGDGQQYIEEISSFNHLRQAYQDCCEQAQVDFVSLFKARKALLEVYSCYPVVPMAFMLASRLISCLPELPELLKQYAVTVSGGMNLAKAPWNNAALSGLISLCQELKTGPQKVALLHGNGGLGYRQGVAILKHNAL